MPRASSPLFRRSARSILAAAFLLTTVFITHSGAVHAATTWTVTTTADDAPGGTCSTPCTLRDALNSAATGDSIDFANTVSGTITLTNGTLTVATGVTINGPGAATLAVDGNSAVTVFTITTTASVTISGLTIQHGDYTGSATGGGGISGIDQGTMFINNCIFSTNTSVRNGGAIYSNGALTVSNSSFSNNAATNGLGGAIVILGGNALISASTFDSNSAVAGGAINNLHVFTVNNSTFSNNSATTYYGGAIFTQNDYDATGSIVSGSTFVTNTAHLSGGAISSFSTLLISNSTFNNNSAPNGGAIDQDVGRTGGPMTISNSTISGNIANAAGGGGTGGGILNQYALNLLSDIIAGNIFSSPNIAPLTVNESDVYNSGGTPLSLGYNLIGDSTNSGLTATTGDQFGSSMSQLDPQLGALANNSGLTQTMAITSSSLAFQMGYCGGNTTVTPNAIMVATDQRGSARKGTTTGCDVGAYEAILPATNTPTNTTQFTPTNTATNTATSTPTNTLTNTPTNTATFTPSNTATNTATFTPTNTAANTATFTPSNTPSNTVTNTPTNTSTFTPTRTFTPSATATATTTATATSTTTPLPGRIDSIGIYRGGTFYLRLHNTTGFADLSAHFTAGSRPYPVVGDWTGLGFDSIGVMDQATANFYLRNTISAGAADETFTLGNPNDTPLAGRWQLSATHAGAGVYRPSNGVLYLKNALTTGFADHAMVLGLPGDAGIAGDWTGKGFDSPGVYRASSLGFFLSNQVTNGPVFADITLTYGAATDLPITGDWIAQGHDGVGMFRPTNGNVYLKNILITGFADNTFFYGTAGDQPVAGHWQAIYPPAPPAPILIAKTAVPKNSGSSGGIAPGSNQIGG